MSCNVRKMGPTRPSKMLFVHGRESSHFNYYFGKNKARCHRCHYRDGSFRILLEERTSLRQETLSDMAVPVAYICSRQLAASVLVQLKANLQTASTPTYLSVSSEPASLGPLQLWNTSICILRDTVGVPPSGGCQSRSYQSAMLSTTECTQSY